MSRHFFKGFDQRNGSAPQEWGRGIMQDGLFIGRDVPLKNIRRLWLRASGMGGLNSRLSGYPVA